MSFVTVLVARLLDVLDYEPPRMRVYKVRPGSERTAWNVDCSDPACAKRPIGSLGILAETITLAENEADGGTKARRHLTEAHGWRP